jgi:hypothetical protein
MDKIYLKDNYVVTELGGITTVFSKNYTVYSENTTTFFLNSSFPINNARSVTIDFSRSSTIFNEAGTVAYTTATLRSFFLANTGFKSPSGGSGGVWGSITGTLSSQTDLQSALDAKQDDLISGTNIKSINGNSLLGSGDISIPSTILYNSTSPVLVTGTTNETLIASIPIPTSITNTILRASFVVVVTTLAAGNPRTRMRIGTIPTPTSVQLSTQTQLGTNAVGSTSAVSMYRTMPVVGGVLGNIKVIAALSNVNADYGVANSYDTILVDWTTQRYIYFTIQNFSLGAVTQCYGALLEQLKQ